MWRGHISFLPLRWVEFVSNVSRISRGLASTDDGITLPQKIKFHFSFYISPHFSRFSCLQIDWFCTYSNPDRTSAAFLYAAPLITRGQWPFRLPSDRAN